MDAFRKVVQSATAASKKIVESGKAKVAELQATPTHIRCSACPQEMLIPPQAFHWYCASGHLNAERTEFCVMCNAPAAKDMPAPCVACPHCHTVTAIASSNARKHVRETTVKTKEYVAKMKSAPKHFHCAHCNTLLAVPTGPWTCQTCNSENVEECLNCWQCTQKKSMQRAICGVCRTSTPISSTVFADNLKSSVKSVTESSKKIYYDVAGTPYVTCQMCYANVSLPKKDGSAATPLLLAAGGPPGGGGGAGAEGQPRGAAPAPAQQMVGAPGGLLPYHCEGVQCPQCHNPIEIHH